MSQAGFSVRVADASDLPAVLGVQRQAFGRVAEQFGLDPDHLPPLKESLADLQQLHRAGVRFFVATTAAGEIIGSVRASHDAGIVEIGRLVVEAAWLRRGVATELMAALEQAYPHAVSFTLFTGAEAAEPLALYAKLGYGLSRRENVGPYVLVWLEKPGPIGR